MTIGEVIEELIFIKSHYDIGYPKDESINAACNILKRLPRAQEVYEWIEENEA